MYIDGLVGIGLDRMSNITRLNRSPKNIHKQPSHLHITCLCTQDMDCVAVCVHAGKQPGTD